MTHAVRCRWVLITTGQDNGGRSHCRSPHLPLHDRNFFVGEVVEFVDGLVDLVVGDVDEALEMFLVLVGAGGGALFVEVENLSD